MKVAFKTVADREEVEAELDEVIDAVFKRYGRESEEVQELFKEYVNPTKAHAARETHAEAIERFQNLQSFVQSYYLDV